MKLHVADYLIILVYFAFVITVGFIIKRKIKSSNDFLSSGRNIPLWINQSRFYICKPRRAGSIGHGSIRCKVWYHGPFTFIGWAPYSPWYFSVYSLMPFYYGSRARSVPEYLSMRFDEKTRGLNAISFAVMTVFSSGISLYAFGKIA